MADVKLGILARAEDRGLGIQTWEAVRHLDPERVLVVDVGAHERFGLHLDRYPGATVVRLDEKGWTLPEAETRAWLDGLDVVFTCETFYDARFARWARAAGVRTVVQANPEFIRPEWDLADLADVWWNPSTWRMDTFPAGSRHMPVPVALDRFTPSTGEHPPRFFHTVGKWAAGDRNGTTLLQQSLRYVRQPVRVTIAAQERILRTTTRSRARVEYRVQNVADYWRLYDGHEVLVLPRRYGGLCLPAQEAMAAGLAVLMPDTSPNTDMWPVLPLPCRNHGIIDVPAGRIPLVECDPTMLARILVRLHGDPAEVEALRAGSRAWAAAHSWDVLRPVYLAEFEQVARRDTLRA